MIRIVIEIDDDHLEEALEFAAELLGEIDHTVDNTDVDAVEVRYRTERIVGKGLEP